MRGKSTDSDVAQPAVSSHLPPGPARACASPSESDSPSLGLFHCLPLADIPKDIPVNVGSDYGVSRLCDAIFVTRDCKQTLKGVRL